MLSKLKLDAAAFKTWLIRNTEEEISKGENLMAIDTFRPGFQLIVGTGELALGLIGACCGKRRITKGVGAATILDGVRRIYIGSIDAGRLAETFLRETEPEDEPADPEESED